MFRQAMKAARGADNGDDPVAQAQAQAAYEAADDRTECPHCGRKFNDVAAQRHIPVCGEKIKANKIQGKPTNMKAQAQRTTQMGFKKR